MPVTYESDGGGVFAAANNNNAITVPLPATRPLGSVLLLAAFCRLITAAAPTITGYTLLGTWTSGTASGGRVWLYGRIVDGSESAPSVTPVGATGTSGDIFGAGIVCYSGVNTSGGITTIFDGTPTITDASGTTTCTYPALTIAQADSMVMRMLARFRDAADTFTPTATWNERADLGTTNRTGGQFHMQDKLATASGAQASVTIAPSNTTAARYLAVTLALKAVQPKQTATAEISLGTIPTPDTRTQHKIVVRARVASGSGTIRAQLYEGGTARSAVLESSALTGSFVDYTLAVADGDAAGITSYTNLSVRITGYSAGGAGVFEVSQLYLEAPAGAAGPQTLYGVTSTSITFGKAVAGQRKTFGQVVRPFTFAATTAGKVTQTHFGSLALPITFGVAVAGQRKAFGQVALPIIFAKDVLGQRKTFGQVVSPFTFGKAVVGQRKTFSQLALPINVAIATAGFRPGLTQYGIVSLPVVFGKDIRGQRKTFGQLLSPFIFGEVVSGQRKTFSQIAFPITAAIDIKGTRLGLTQYGVVALPVTFGKDIRGQRRAFGQIVLPIAFAKDVRGQRKTFGQFTLPIIFTKEAVGRKNVFGQLAMQTLFGKEVSGRRKTFSQFVMPIAFSKAVSGRRQTFGKIALPLNFPVFVNGSVQHNLYGSLSMPLVFSKQVAARRKTFGQVTAPFIFGEFSKGQRRTFSALELPLDFEAIVQSGRVGTYGLVELELIFAMDTTGNIKLLGIILNDALDLYLGEQIIDSVYVGSELVWP